MAGQVLSAKSASRRWRIMIGLKELALVAVVVLVLYGRSGVVKSRQFQTIWPWISPLRRKTGRPGTRPSSLSSRESAAEAPTQAKPVRRSGPLLLQGNRLYWLLTILAATAVAAWVITRVMIASGAGPGVTH
jgi:hypothetical protein